jgi:hypothetical protein
MNFTIAPQDIANAARFVGWKRVLLAKPDVWPVVLDDHFADFSAAEVFAFIRNELPEEDRHKAIRATVREPQHLVHLAEFLLAIDTTEQRKIAVQEIKEAWKESYIKGVNKIIMDEYRGVYEEQMEKMKVYQ